jgi:hypothetical protein
MKTITTFEQYPVRISHSLLAIVGEPLISISNPHRRFAVNTAK